jgi:hypothetical protein
MSDYTETFSNSPGDTILATEFQTEFTAIKTAIATKFNLSVSHDAYGSSIIDQWWKRDTAAQLTAGYAYARVDIGTVTGVDPGPTNFTPNCALGNVFSVLCDFPTSASNVGLSNPSNPIAGTELFLITKIGTSTPDGNIPVLSGANIKYSSTGGSRNGGTAGKYNVYHLLYDGTNWFMVKLVNQV